MAARVADAAAADPTVRRLSHTQLGAYAAGRVKTVPDEQTQRAIAAALGVDVEEVAAAAWPAGAAKRPDGVTSQHALAFVRLTEGRTDEEMRRTLGVVEAMMHAMDASREAVESNFADEGPGVSTDT
jgi:hypothetical protein